jgi:hypothetical protein
VNRDIAINQLVGGSGAGLDWFWLSENSKVADILSGFASKEAGTFE